MWKRIKRAVNSNLGRLKSDPMSSSVPSQQDVKALGESLGVVRSQVALLEKDLLKLQSEETKLSARIRTALDGNDRAEALKHAGILSKVRDDMARVSSQLTRAREVCQKAEGLFGAAGGSPYASAPGPALAAGELDAAAEDTLSRLEGDLISEGKLAGRPGDPANKSVAESGPSKTIADSGPQPSTEKTIGGQGRGAEAARNSAAKTIGGGVERSAEREAPKTIGGSEETKPSGSSDLLDELERLAKLKEKGILTAEEFQAAKKKLLGS